MKEQKTGTTEMGKGHMTPINFPSKTPAVQNKFKSTRTSKNLFCDKSAKSM